jgi:V8-like Glu-specific endopeptidase
MANYSVGEFNSKYKICTGWVSDNYHFVTAEHCADYPKYVGQKATLEVDGVVYNGRLERWDASRDIAVYRTERVLPEPLTIGVADTSGWAMLLTFRGDFQSMSRCSYQSPNGVLVKHTCKSHHGASGAPLIDILTSEVIGMHWSPGYAFGVDY